MNILYKSFFSQIKTPLKNKEAFFLGERSRLFYSCIAPPLSLNEGKLFLKSLFCLRKKLTGFILFSKKNKTFKHSYCFYLLKKLSLKSPTKKSSKIKVNASKIISNLDKLMSMEYSLDNYHRSNQDTCLVHKPSVFEGQWVQSGDLLADCSASVGGELALGQNILIAYMPWEGYNFEDAILISERLVYDDLYTSIHIERYEVELRETKLGMEEITREIPDVSEESIRHLHRSGIAKLGSWIEEGDILVGKVTPINKKNQSNYQKLLYTILEKPVLPVRDSSLRAPKGIKAKVVGIQILKKNNHIFIRSQSRQKKVRIPPLSSNITKPVYYLSPPNSDIRALSGNIQGIGTGFLTEVRKKKKLYNKVKKKYISLKTKPKSKNKQLRPLTNFNLSSTKLNKSFFSSLLFEKRVYSKTKTLFLNNNKELQINGAENKNIIKSFSYNGSNNNGPFSINYLRKEDLTYLNSQTLKKLPLKNPLYNDNDNDNDNGLHSKEAGFFLDKNHRLFFPKKKKQFAVIPSSRSQSLVFKMDATGFGAAEASRYKKSSPPATGFEDKPGATNLHFLSNFYNKNLKQNKLINLKAPYGFKKGVKSLVSQKNKEENTLRCVQIYLAEKRRIQVGDKMAGRHGNKGIISQILPPEDMPFLPDGTPLDMVLNPLGVPSRMNVGQIYECLLGLAGKHLGENFKVFPFDEIYGAEASRSFVFSKLYNARIKTGKPWLFNANSPGKIRLYDGRTGESFDQAITVGYAYMLRLVHMVDDKIHARSTGPYSLVTQQPLRGRSKQGGQRLGEMEVWALEGYGAAFTLLEMLTIKSDDMTGRMTLWSNLILNKEISIGTPESFKVLICELQALCLDIGLFRVNSKVITK